jgi:hypothetical protein
MKIFAFLILISPLCFSQVFVEDTTFLMGTIMKEVPSPSFRALNLPNGKVLINHQGQVVNDSIKLSTILWNPADNTVKSFPFYSNDIQEPLYNSQVSNTGQFIFYKSTTYMDNGDAISTLTKLDLNGNVIKNFSLKENGFLSQVFELAEEKILCVFNGGNTKVFDSSGKFESVFSLSKIGFGTQNQLRDLVFHKGLYFFLLKDNTSGKTSLVRTDEYLANPKEFKLPILDNSTAPQSILFRINDKIHLYTSSLNDQINHLFEFDLEGNQISDVVFGKVGDFMSSNPEVFSSDNGDISLKYAANDWIHIKANGTFSIYSKEKNIIHFLKNGKFLVRKPEGLIETVMPDENGRYIPLTFGRKLTFSAGKVFTSKNGISMVEYKQSTHGPFMIYHSLQPNLVRFFNKNGVQIKELFDNESRWFCSSQGEFNLAVGEDSIYYMEGENNIETFDNVWPSDAQFDLKNKSVYSIDRYFVDGNSKIDLVKSDFNGIKDEAFFYKSATNSFSIQFIPEYHELALFSNEIYGGITFINPENGEFLREKIIGPDVNANFYSTKFNEIISTNNGMYLRSVWVGGTGGYSYTLIRVTKENVSDKEFLQRKISGGQFNLVQKDGSVVFNTLSIGDVGNGKAEYTSVKLLTSGQIDTSFSILSKENILHFAQQDDNTIYTVTAKGLKRFERKDGVKSQYFYVNSEMSNNVAWDKLKPIYFKVLSAGINFEITFSENVRYRNDSLHIDPLPGSASISIKNEEGKEIYFARMSIGSATPNFIYPSSSLYANQGPTWLKFSSTSGMPVYIKNGQNSKEFKDSVLVDPTMVNIGLYLRTEANAKYTASDEYVVLEVQKALANEANSENNYLPYPNPNKGVFKLKVVSEVNNNSLQITDVLGREIPFSYWKENQELFIQMNQTIPGVYLLNLKMETKQKTFRLLVE